jgi:3-oxoacyl-[acyl-carrier-protein] synthase II
MGIIPPDAQGQAFSAKEFVPKSYRKAVKVMARDSEIAVACAKLAVDDAGLVTRAVEGGTPTYPPDRSGCQIGAGLLAAETLELTTALATAVSASPSPEMHRRGGFDYRQWGTVANDTGQVVGGMNNLQPLWMLKYLPNMLACHVSIIHGTEGPSNTITCSEASGLLSIGEASRVIERGDADLCLSGSAESKTNLSGLARMHAMGRLAKFKDWTGDTGRIAPFSASSMGGVPGEGGGILALEAIETARARGAKPYARITGFGAGHAVWRKAPPYPAPDINEVNTGLERAVRAALADARLNPHEIDAIIPQACGSAPMDVTEANALRRVFGEKIASIPCVMLSPSIGDCFAGTGGVQTALACAMLREQALPALCITLPTNSGQEPAPASEGATSINNVLICGASVGGQCAALVVRKAT